MIEDDDARSGLSEAAAKLRDSIDLRRHNVNLERVQRIHLGIDNEAMDFSAGCCQRDVAGLGAGC